MTINSVTSNNDLYEAMVQQAAALRSAKDARPPAARSAPAPTGQSASARTETPASAEPDTFARNLSAQTRLVDRRPATPPATTQPDPQLFQKKVAGTYRSPWADANSLVVQTRSPGTLPEPSNSGTSVTAAASAKPAAPYPRSTVPPPEAGKPTFVEVHSVYVDAADEESGRSTRNPLFQFAAQLYQDVVATSRRSAGGVFIGSSFSGVA